MLTPYSDQTKISLLQLLVLSGFFIFSTIASAEVSPSVESHKISIHDDLVYQNGELTITLPHSDMPALLKQISVERQALSTESDKLQQVIDDKQFKGSDLFIIAILPGGMIYSAIKRGQLEQAENEQKQVNSLYSNLTQDQLALELSTLDTQIASYY